MVSQGNSVTAKVTSVGALTSNLKLSETTFASDTTIVATALTRLSLQRFPIWLDLGIPYPKGWVKALSEQKSLNIHNACNQSKGCLCSFTVAMLDHESYEIRDKTNHTLLCLPAFSTDAAQVLELVEHLAKFELVKSLTNNSVADSTNQFKSSFSVQLIKPAGDKIDPGCLQIGQNQQVCSHPECLVEVEDGTFLQLEVKNNREEGGHAFCLHIYSIGYFWEIENILVGDYEVVPSCLSNKSQEFRKGSNGVWNKRLEMTILSEAKEKGEKYCDDIIKVFLTSQPTSFLLLELPELGKSIGRNELRKYRGKGSYSSSEDWIALSFRIRTRMKEE